MSQGVIQYRSFRNIDTPGLLDIWASQPPGRSPLAPPSVEALEHLVLAKPYFDPHGLIVALDDGRPVGFVHAGFGPSDDERSLCARYGLTCLVMVRPDRQQCGIGAELVERSEAYLRSRGAEVLYGGGVRPLNPFYLGLHGGSELPGVLDSEPRAQRLFLNRQYREIDRSLVFQLHLPSFRPVIDRLQVQIRRGHAMQEVFDPPPRTWWEACTAGELERVRLELVSRQSQQPVATADFWPMRPHGSNAPAHAVGLIDLETVESGRRQGLATFLLCEAFRHFGAAGVATVEVQTMQRNVPAVKFYEKLGFRCIDQGAVYRKDPA